MLKTQQLSYPIQNFHGVPKTFGGFRDFRYRFFRALYDFCFQNGHTFIAYAQPHQRATEEIIPLQKSRDLRNFIGKEEEKDRQIRILIAQGLQQRLLLDIRDLTASRPGFVFSPFDLGSETSRSRFSFFEVGIIIPVDEWRVDTRKGRSVYSGKVNYRDDQETMKILDRLNDYLLNHSEKDQGGQKEDGFSKVYTTEMMPPTKKDKGRDNTVSTGKKKFYRQVSEQRSQLHSPFNKKNKKDGGSDGLDKLRKIVISKLKIITPPPDSDLIQLFFKLITDFPFSLVNWVSGSEVGSWMGASPEILVRRDSRKIFQTMSLAGTQWIRWPNNSSNSSNKGEGATDYPPGFPLHRVAWTQKEIEEQMVTSRFIIDCFKKIRLREYIEEGPVTVRKGNLLHLQSTFTVDLKRYYGDSLPYEMISLLHPTPAVGGMPPDQALKEIRRLESHDRRYYAGYLGPVEIDGAIDIYVNLRCMEWLRIGGRLRCGLYAGVGVNSFSRPDQEWKETEAKMKWLLEAVKETGKSPLKEVGKISKKNIRPRKSNE